MITIRKYYGGQYFDIPNDLILSLENNSSFFSDNGSYSLPISLPFTPNNKSLVDYCQRIDSEVALPNIDVIVQNGIYSFKGVLKILSYNEDEGIECSILSHQSSITAALGDKTLPQLWGNAVLHYEDSISELVDWIKDQTRPETDDTDENHPLHKISCFPVATSTCILNQQRYADPSHPAWPDFLLIARDTRIIYHADDYLINYPTGCWCTPFVRLWYIIDRIATVCGLELDNEDNIFRTGKYKYLCLLNNSIDSCMAMAGNLYTVLYRHLMPDIKVTDFIAELFNQFGIVLSIEGSALKTYQINDILSSDCEVDFDKYISGALTVNYAERQALEITQDAEPLVVDESISKAESYQTFKKNINGSEANIILRTLPYFNSTGIQHNKCEYNPDNIDTFQNSAMQRCIGFFNWIPEDLNNSHYNITQTSVPYQTVRAEAIQSGILVAMPYIGDGLNRVLNITVTKEDNTIVDCTLNAPCPLCFAYDNVGLNYNNRNSKLRYGSRVLYKDGYTGVRADYDDGDVFSSDISLSPHNTHTDMLAYDEALRNGMHEISVSLNMTSIEILSLSFFKPVIIHGRKCILKSYRTEVSDNNITVLDAVFLTI